MSANKIGRNVAMNWISDSYDEIVDTIDGSNNAAGGQGFARLASTIIGKRFNPILLNVGL